MTHFVDTAAQTPSPEQLSLSGKAAVLLTGVRVARPTNQRTPADVGLPFSVHSIASLDGRLLEAWHVAAEDPRGICLLFHGYAESKSRLIEEAAVFHDMGFDVLLLDFRGCGGSEGDVTTIGYREADDVAAAIAYVQDTIPSQTMVLFGRSMGSAAVMRAAAVHDIQPSAIVLECPFDRLLSTTRNRFAAMGVPAFPAAELLVFWGGIQFGDSGFNHNPAENARSVQCPTMLIHGAQDPRVTEVELKNVFNNLAGGKHLVEFPGVGHASCRAADPTRWRRLIEAFLDDDLHHSARPER